MAMCGMLSSALRHLKNDLWADIKDLKDVMNFKLLVLSLVNWAFVRARTSKVIPTGS